jgi:hypothetical protein
VLDRMAVAAAGAILAFLAAKGMFGILSAPMQSVSAALAGAE